MKNLLFFFLSFSVLPLIGQVTEQFDKQDLEDVLSLLEKKYHLKIAYDPALIDGVKITGTYADISINDFFKEILKDTELSYERVKRNYYLIRKSDVLWAMSGQVLNSEKGGIPFAKIRILNSYKMVYADEDGFFKIEYYADNPPDIEITCLGFKKKTINAEDFNAQKTIILNWKTVQFEKVVVEYLTEGISTAEDISMITVLPKKIGAVPGSTEPDIFQMAQYIPGIHSANSNVSEIQIRGGTSDQNHILWEGIPIYHPGHFNGMFSTINSNIVDKVELHRGVYDPYYGGKASGLIELSSINHIPSKIKTGVGINMMQADAYVQIPIKKKMGLLVSGRRSYVDLWKSPTYLRYAERVYQNTDVLSESDFKNGAGFFSPVNDTNVFSNDLVYYDLNGKFIYKINEKNHLTINGLYTQSALAYSYYPSENEEYYNEIHSSNAGLSVNYKRIMTKKWRSNLLFSYASYNYYFYKDFTYLDNVKEVTELFYKSNVLNYTALNWRNKYTINKNQSINGGYQIFYTGVDYSLVYNDQLEGVEQVGSNNGYTNAFHINYKLKKRRLLVQIGLRASYLNTTDDIDLEPRLYGQYRLNENFILKAGFAMQNQAISQIDQFQEEDIGLSNRVWVMANAEDIPELKSRILNFGLRFEQKGWHFEVEGYFKQINNIVNFSEDYSLSSGLLRGDAYARGVDVLIRKRWKNIRSWVSYSYNDVLYDFKNYSVNEFPASFNQPHTFKWLTTISWRQFEFSSAFKIASGKYYTNAIGTSAISEINEETGETTIVGYDVVYGTPYNKNLPLFHQLDFSLFYSFPKNPDIEWKGKVGFSCINVYNKKNVLNRLYGVNTKVNDITGKITPELYTIDKYYLKFTPNIILRFEF